MDLENLIFEVLQRQGEAMTVTDIASSLYDSCAEVTDSVVADCVLSNNKVFLVDEDMLCSLREWSRGVFFFKMAKLEAFIKQNGHFPFSSGDDVERRLYVWWKDVSKCKSLDEMEQGEVQRIISQYSDFMMDKRRYDWDFKIEQYWAYAEKNNAFPPLGSSLYNWYCNNRFGYLKGKLDERQQTKFKELYDYVEGVRKLMRQHRRIVSHPIAHYRKLPIDKIVVKLF